MKILLGICFLLCSLSSAYAQTNTYSSRDDSDPQALSLLQKLKTHIQKDRLAVEFQFSMTLPESEPEVQTGTFVMQGKMYRITTSDYEIWCNGTSRWVLEKKANEVNLYSAGDNKEELSPAAIFLEITGDQYISVITESAPTTEILELKPIDRYSEVSKIRVTLHKDSRPLKLEVFEKSGTRTTLDVKKMSTPDRQKDSYFTFDATAYPGVHIEDLRIE